jgi:hypothetical protein
MSFGILQGKMVFLGGSGVILGFLEWLEGFGSKNKDFCRVWNFFRDFCGFLEGLECFRTYL